MGSNTVRKPGRPPRRPDAPADGQALREARSGVYAARQADPLYAGGPAFLLAPATATLDQLDSLTPSTFSALPGAPLRPPADLATSGAATDAATPAQTGPVTPLIDTKAAVPAQGLPAATAATPASTAAPAQSDAQPVAAPAREEIVGATEGVIAEGQAETEGVETDDTSLGGGRQVVGRRDGAAQAGGLPFAGELTLPEQVAPTAELQPLTPVPPIPFHAPHIAASFDAPTSLDTGAIRMPKAADAAADKEASAALTYAARSYAEAVGNIRTRQSRTIESVNGAISTMGSAYGRLRDSIPTALERADQSLTNAFDRAAADVEQAAFAADIAVVRDYGQARGRLNGAAAAARTAVKASADSAQGQIDAIVADLAKAFVDPLTDAKTSCEQASAAAESKIGTWKSQLSTLFDPNTGDGRTQARHESHGKAGKKVADDALIEVARRKKQIVDGFATSSTETQKSVRGSVEPELKKHTSQIQTSGTAAVDKAFSSALQSLKRQANDARAAIARMRADLLSQLITRRSAARASLEAAARQAIVDAHRAVETGARTLEDASAQTVPLYAQAAHRLVDSLAQAGQSGGPQSLRQAAAQTPAAVVDSVEQARTAQSEQTEAVSAGVETNLGEREAGLEKQLAATLQDAQEQIAVIAIGANASLSLTAERMTSGFSALADGVSRAAQSWTQPLTQHFAGFINKSREELKKKLPAFTAQVSTNLKTFIGWITPQQTPDSFFQPALQEAWNKVYKDLIHRQNDLVKAFDSGIIDKVDEGGVTAALRGLTKAQGAALRQIWFDGSLDAKLADKLDSDSNDYRAAINYLNGNAAAGARYELEASVHWYNDEEARIEATMRALSPEQIKQLHQLDGWKGTEDTIRDALGGTDLKVFDALAEANYARADVYRLRDKIDDARREGDSDAVTTLLAQYTSAPQPEDYGGQEIKEEDRRAMIRSEFAHIQQMDPGPRGYGEQGGPITDLAEYAIRPITMASGEGGAYTQSITGAQAGLARALVAGGENSVDARAASLGVEVERGGGPNIINLDKALVDPRLNPNEEIPPEIREQARKEREQVLKRFAKEYGGKSDDIETARADLIGRLRGRFDSGDKGADLTTALIKDEYPTPATAALAMEYAIEGVGTNNELIDRTLGRMDRTEIAKMKAVYNESGKRDLFADLGVYGHGTFGDLSGDDRLRAERMLLGKPRNDREQAEVAAFAIYQQRQETGAVGRWLADGSLRERELNHSEQQLAALSGGQITFKDGVPDWVKPGNFNQETGAYTGPDVAEFRASAHGAQLSAESYAGKIDQYANAAATTIAVIGAIVAAVATGGAASPLLAAAIAGGTGLASMGARRLISGGRYGWEQASVDLTMTAVQALTAGVGQHLALATQGAQGMQALNNKVLIGMLTGGMGSLAETALSEETYKKGFGGALGELFGGTLRGAISGGATASVSHAIEGIPIGRLSKAFKPTLGESMGQSTSFLGRGLGKGLTSGVGAFAGKGAELGFESARGKFKGDAGDIFVAASEAALQSSLQGFGEGTAEAGAQRYRNRAEGTGVHPSGESVPASRPTDLDSAEGAQHPAAARPTTDDEATLPAARPTTADEATTRPAVTDETARPAVTDESARPAARPAADETTLPAARPAADEAARPAARPPTADEQSAAPPRAAEAAGEAAAVRGSRFRGDALDQPNGGTMNKAVQAVERLIESGRPLNGVASQSEEHPAQLKVKIPGEADVPVRLQVTDTMAPLADGSVPVARFDKVGDEIVIQISSRAHPEVIERALAHELAEIAAGSRAATTTDALKPGGAGVRPTADGEPPPLSPHDRGRLAELDVLAHQIGQAQASGETQKVTQLQDEAQRLVAHMGLADPSDASVARRSLAADELPPTSPARALLAEAVAAAEVNPFLQTRPGDLTGDLDLLASQLAHARSLGDKPLEAQVLELARRRVIEGDLVTPGTTKDVKSTIDRPAIDRLAASDPARAALLAEAEGLARANPHPDQPGVTPHDPGLLDPHGTEAARRQFGDRPNAQDWPEFRERFFGTRTGADPSSPRDLAEAYARWSSGEYVDPITGRTRSLAVSTRRPDPGFEAHFQQDPAPRPELLPPGAGKLPSGESVNEAMQARRNLIEGRGLAEELRDPAITPARKAEVEARLQQLDIAPAAQPEKIGAEINARSEQLGEAAGRQFASQHHSDLSETPLLRKGANVPDLVFEGPGGRVLIVEAKGGNSPLGVRRSADGTHMVEQGTHAYLESLATTMTHRPDTEELGRRILKALNQVPPTVDYVVVRQPFHKDGSLAAPEVGRFDISAPVGRPRPPHLPSSAAESAAVSASPRLAAPLADEASAGLPTPARPTISPADETASDTGAGRSGTAAAVEGATFRGDALPTPRAAAESQAEAHSAARRLLDPASSLARFAGMADQTDPTRLTLTTESGATVKVQVVSSDSLAPHDGSIPVARFTQTRPGEYEIQLSTRASAGSFERALAHELSEIHYTHGRAEMPDILTAGGFGSDQTPRGARPQLSPHDHGRLAEVEVLARLIAAAQADGSPDQAARLRDEAQRLMAHLGIVDDTPAARLRRDVALNALADRPTAQKLLADAALAARDNPFLRLPPVAPRDYLDHLLDRMDHARALGDTTRQQQVLEQARARLSFSDDKAIITGPDGAQAAYKIPWFEQRTAGGSAPRAALFLELITHARARLPHLQSSFARPNQPPANPALLDPDSALAVARRNSDQRHYQSWDEFRSRAGVGSATPLAEQLRLFDQWASGMFISPSSRIPSSLAAKRTADITPLDYQEHVDPSLRPSDTIDNTSALARTGRSIEAWVTRRSDMIAERDSLQTQLKTTADPDTRHKLSQRLRQIQGRDIPHASERLGEATAIRFARQRFAVPESSLLLGSGSGVPDLGFRIPAPGGQGSLPVVVEAKGGQSPLNTRLSADGTHMVQQGTREYLKSLSLAMQRSSDDQVAQFGREIELALEHFERDRATAQAKGETLPTINDYIRYHMVRQPFDEHTGQMGVPMMATFDLTTGGRRR